MSGLKGKNAIVTGGGKNLGALIAESLAKEGVNVAIHYNSAASKAETEATLKKLEASGVKAVAIQADLSTSAAASEKRTRRPRRKQVGHCHQHRRQGAQEAPRRHLRGRVRLDDGRERQGQLLLSAAKHLNDGGAIISVVTSLLGAFTGFYSTYQGSKAPVEWFTKAAAKELMPRGIRVNAVAPGPMDTPFFYGQEEDAAVAFHKSQALGGRLTDIQDIAPLVLYLCNDKWINGQVLFSNGGYTTR